MEQELSELVGKLKQAAGSNLKAVVLYGSAVSGEFHSKHSDLNVLCVLERLDGTELERLNPASTWWVRKGYPAPLVFTLEELRRSADVFAIELLDIKTSHRILFGEDVFASLDVPINLHHLQVERELRNDLVRLRQRHLSARQSDRTVLQLMIESVSSFTALFRHALIALGEQSPSQPHRQKRDVVDRLASILGFDPSGFHAVLDLREGKRSAKQFDVAESFRAYLEAVTRVVEEIDERLAQRSRS